MQRQISSASMLSTGAGTGPADGAGGASASAASADSDGKEVGGQFMHPLESMDFMQVRKVLRCMNTVHMIYQRQHRLPDYVHYPGTEPGVLETLPGPDTLVEAVGFCFVARSTNRVLLYPGTCEGGCGNRSLSVWVFSHFPGDLVCMPNSVSE